MNRITALLARASIAVACATSSGCATFYFKEFEVTDQTQAYAPEWTESTVDYSRFADWPVNVMVKTRAWASDSLSDAERASIDEYEVSFDFPAVSQGYNGYALGTFEVRVDGISIAYLRPGAATPANVEFKPLEIRPCTQMTAGKLKIADDVENIEVELHYALMLDTSDKPAAEHTFKLKLRRTLSNYVQLR